MKTNNYKEILDFFNKEKSVTVKEIAANLHVSEMTVRRKLKIMEQNGLVDRFHGGAKIVEQEKNEDPFLVKIVLNSDIKKRIGRYAASLIKDNMVIYIDAGSTTSEMIDYIFAKNIYVVTDGIIQAEKLIKKGIKTHMLCGNVNIKKSAVIGRETVGMLEKFNFDIAFIGTNAIHEKAGFTTTDEYEALAKTSAIERAKKAYILTDSSKFNMICISPFAKLNQATIITDDVSNFNKSLIDYIIV